MDKDQIRQEVTEKIKNLSQEDHKAISQDLFNQLVQTEKWQQASVIGLTMSDGLEWETRPIIEQAWKEGKKVAVPKAIKKGSQMDFRQIDSFDQVEAGFAGISEPDPDQTQSLAPEEIDLLVVPGRVFTPEGYRIGFGGGFYDRYLAKFDNPTISLVWQGQLTDNLPTDQYDLPVQKLLISEL